MTAARRLLLAGSGSGAFVIPEDDVALGWFNVKTYGALGDGTTDDTSAINAAITSLNSNGGGRLYLPHGSYLCSSALTAITVPCIVEGDGAAIPYAAAGIGSRVLQSSATASLFTFSDDHWIIRDIALDNTNGGTPSAGAGIVSGTAYFARMSNVTVSGFYDGIDLSDGAGWSLTDCFIHDPVRYGIRVRGTVSPDSGDQSISGCYFMSDVHNGTAAIRLESAGGLKITNTKINERGTGGRFVDGVQVSPGSGISTSVLLIANSSIENVSGDAVDVSAGGGSFGLVQIVGLEVALYGNNTGRAVKLADVDNVMIDGCIFVTSGTARAAVSLTNTDNVTLGDIELVGFNACYLGSGDTNTDDNEP